MIVWSKRARLTDKIVICNNIQSLSPAVSAIMQQADFQGQSAERTYLDISGPPRKL